MATESLDDIRPLYALETLHIYIYSFFIYFFIVLYLQYTHDYGSLTESRSALQCRPAARLCRRRHHLLDKTRAVPGRHLLFTRVDESTHTPSTAFRHLPPNSARFSFATEGALFISAQLSSDAVSAIRKAGSGTNMTVEAT